MFKKYSSLALETKIKIYSLKILNNLENAKVLCKNEKLNFEEKEKFLADEQDLQTIDLDYDTIHSEILENIIIDENDSGVSDLDVTQKECSQKKIFEINKIKTIIHKSVKSLFNECQEDDQFKPLIQQINNLKKDNYKKDKDSQINCIDNKTKESTNDSWEIKIENVSLNNTIDKTLEKEKEIVNYKKYNYINDPNSNYNNFTKKYIVQTNMKKRFRDSHPFLKTFNPKFLKKENIDKKIFRKFRKFVKSLYKENINSEIFKKNPEFWKKFYVKNLLPPVSIVGKNGETIIHKSFNSSYLIWLFSQEGTTELYKLFKEKESKKIIQNFIDGSNLKEANDNDDEIKKLKDYIEYVPEIYSSMNGDENNMALEEQKEEINMNKFDEEKNEEIFDSDNDSLNPFNINFDLIGKKHFKEVSYDYNTYYFNEKNNISNFPELDAKSEKFGLEDSFRI